LDADIACVLLRLFVPKFTHDFGPGRALGPSEGKGPLFATFCTRLHITRNPIPLPMKVFISVVLETKKIN
jgi:hypothetical protein